MEEKLTMRVRLGRQCACVSHEVNHEAKRVWTVRGLEHLVVSDDRG